MHPKKQNPQEKERKCPSCREIIIVFSRAAFAFSLIIGNVLYFIMMTYGIGNKVTVKIIGVCFFTCLISSGFIAFMTHDFDGAGNNSGLPL